MKLLSQLQIAECLSQQDCSCADAAITDWSWYSAASFCSIYTHVFNWNQFNGMNVLFAPHRTIGYIVTQVPLVKRLSLHLLYPTYMYV